MKKLFVMTGKEIRMFSKMTEFLGLPQWQPEDHPDFLTDMNEAYRKIDDGVNSADAGGKENYQQLLNIKAEVDILGDTTQELHNTLTTLSSDLEDYESATGGEIEDIKSNIALVDAKTTILNTALTDETTARTAKDNELDDSIDTIIQDMSDMKEDITDLESGLLTQKSNIKDLKSDMEASQVAISGLSNDITMIHVAMDSYENSFNIIDNKFEEITSHMITTRSFNSTDFDYEGTTIKFYISIPSYANSISGLFYFAGMDATGMPLYFDCNFTVPILSNTTFYLTTLWNKRTTQNGINYINNILPTVIEFHHNGSEYTYIAFNIGVIDNNVPDFASSSCSISFIGDYNAENN